MFADLFVIINFTVTFGPYAPLDYASGVDLRIPLTLHHIFISLTVSFCYLALQLSVTPPPSTVFGANPHIWVAWLMSLPSSSKKERQKLFFFLLITCSQSTLWFSSGRYFLLGYWRINIYISFRFSCLKNN